jgi:methyl-accepting chemotaxis protein
MDALRLTEWWKKIKIKQKLILTFQLSVILPALTIGFFASRIIESKMEADQAKRIDYIRNYTENILDEYKTKLLNYASFLSTEQSIVDNTFVAMLTVDSTRLNDILRKRDQTLDVDHIQVASPQGEIIARSGGGEERLGEKRLRSPLLSPGAAPTVEIVEEMGKYSITSAAPISRSNQVIGTVLAGIDFSDALADRLQSLSGAEVIFEFDHLFLSTFSSGSLRTQPGAALSGKMRVGETDYDIASLPLKTAAGKAIGAIHIAVSREEIEDAKRNMQRTLLGVVLVAIVITLPISYFFSRGITKPIHRVVDLAEKLSQGDLTVEVEADLINTRDEMGILARAISEMANSLKKVMQELIYSIRDSSRQIMISSEGLSSASQQMSADSSQTERLASAVSSSSEQISQNVGNVAAATEEISVTLKEISRNILNAREITNQAVKMAKSADMTISKLGESSVEIGNVVKVITSIAQQTNLLALNAAIEAARAGEMGKGFAVVANEVKDLAKKTAAATDEVSRKIGAIRANTQEAVSVIAGIGEIITEIDKISGSIAAALEEQSATTSEINRKISEAAQGSNEVNRNITGVATASQSTAKTAAEILEASKQLARMGEELMAMVNNFRVESK